MKMSKHGIIDFKAPKYLFKYQPISEYSVSNLKNKILWASRPSVFNDPFEFKFFQNGMNPKQNELDILIDEIDEWKVACFSQDPLNILIWSHYANFHKGMCLGFYNDMITQKVNYSDDFPIVDFSVSDFQLRGREVLKIITTKSSLWSYEQERRACFIPGTSSEVSYPGELFMVAFGVNASSDEIELVKSIVNDEDVYFYKCRFVNKKYKLAFEAV